VVRSKAGGQGGGAYAPYATTCTFIGNTGARGGGVTAGTMDGCIFVGNMATSAEGGAASDNSSLNNCLVLGNSSVARGGGTADSWLTGCTVVSNSAPQGSGVWSGGTANTVNNSIVYYNGSTGTNYLGPTFRFSCTTPSVAGPGNITAAPLFVDLQNGNFHLGSNSPCINAGNNLYITNKQTDLDGNARISKSTVDIGAYEYQSALSLLSYAWLQSYGLPTDGSADFQDTDGDGMNNWQEWMAGTVPTNAASALRMFAPSLTTSNRLILSWQSVTARTYFVQWSTNLSAPNSFSTISSNISGRTNTTAYTNAVSPLMGTWLYRVGVQ